MEQEKEEAKRATYILETVSIYEDEPVITSVIMLGFVAIAKTLYLIAVILISINNKLKK